MKLYVNTDKSEVRMTPATRARLQKVDPTENAKALLAFLRKRLPIGTRCAFGILIGRDIPKLQFDNTILNAYRDIITKPKPEFEAVKIDADLLKVIKKHCPQAIKEK